MELPDTLEIRPFASPADGEVAVPGSKSITNRALLLAALCGKGQGTRLTGTLFSEDTELMLQALGKLGFAATADRAKGEIAVVGQGGEIPAAEAELFVGLAGTAARFLTALCAAAPRGTYRIDGVPQMRRRPMRGLIEALRQLGAEIACENEEGFLPFTIHARGLRGGTVTIDASESSQMLSALLMVAPLTRSDMQVNQAKPVRTPFVNMTVQMMNAFGFLGLRPLDENSLAIPVRHGNQSLPYATPGWYPIEPDATSASYFLALPLAAGGRVRVAGLQKPSPSLPDLQGDLKFAEVLSDAGLTIAESGSGLDISLQPDSRPRGVDRDFRNFSDTFLTLAALAPLLDGPTTIRGIAHTRLQETDRVANMAHELRKIVGQDNVEETEDSLTIRPSLPPKGAETVEIETHGDHRFAMSFAILGCHDRRGDGRPWLKIRDPGCCAKTFPNFFAALDDLRQKSRAQSFIIVAIDGGAASGKSSSARALGGRFHLLHADTGSYYRTVTAELLRRKVAAGDRPALLSALAALRVDTRVEGGSALMEIDGRTAGEEIRGAEVNAAVSHFAALPELRAALLAYQRGQVETARAHGFRGLVMEGRDIGSVIFPQADFRFFLTADPEERARRRAREGRTDTVAERDRLDSSRQASPLAVPPGATCLDTTLLTLEQTVARMAAPIAARLAAP